MGIFIENNTNNYIEFRRGNLDDINDSKKIIEMVELFSLESSAKKPPGIKIKTSLIQNLKDFDNTIIYFAVLHSDPIGMAICFQGFSTFKNARLINVHDFYIRKEYRNKGIGSVFLDYIEQDARKCGFCRMTLEVSSTNERALRLYVKKGFCGSKNAVNKNIAYAMLKELD